MHNNLKRIINQLVIPFDFRYFYFNLFYFLLFFLASTLMQPAHKYMLSITAIFLVFLKIFILWAYNGENLKKIMILKKHKEFFALIILICLFFSNLNYLFHDFGILNATIYITLFILGYFIGFKEDIILKSKENKLNKIINE